jgi:hypothetical protein
MPFYGKYEPKRNLAELFILDNSYLSEGIVGFLQSASPDWRKNKQLCVLSVSVVRC